MAQLKRQKLASDLREKKLYTSAHGSLELLLAVRLDRDIRGRVRHASQAEAIAHLPVVQECLVGLVDGARDDLAGTAGAGACTARVGQLNTLLLSLVEDVNVLRALEGRLAVGRLQGHLEVRRDVTPSRHAAHDGRRRARRQGTALARHEPALLVHGQRAGSLRSREDGSQNSAEKSRTEASSQDSRHHLRPGCHCDDGEVRWLIERAGSFET
mmetsp:Transcript_82080/g.264875  ORF Transcript_82080/g.264875 Transcript_82080/m.264875 type:complete len:213 (+) Transcript_82080:729-1367(+)